MLNRYNRSPSLTDELLSHRGRIHSGYSISLSSFLFSKNKIKYSYLLNITSKKKSKKKNRSTCQAYFCVVIFMSIDLHMLCKYLEVLDHCEEVLILPRVIKFCCYFHWCNSEPLMLPENCTGDPFLLKVTSNLNKG